MKIYIKLAIALIIVSIVLVGCGTNNKVYDSVNIEKSFIKSVGEEDIVRCYSTGTLKGFADQTPQEISRSSYSSYYCYKNKDGNYEGVLCLLDGTKYSVDEPISSELYDYATNPQVLFEASNMIDNHKKMDIEQTYCFDLSDTYGNLICFVTNQGDYVYWNAEDFNYFIPYDVFKEIANFCKQMEETRVGYVVPHYMLKEAYSLTEYSVILE